MTQLSLELINKKLAPYKLSIRLIEQGRYQNPRVDKLLQNSITSAHSLTKFYNQRSDAHLLMICTHETDEYTEDIAVIAITVTATAASLYALTSPNTGFKGIGSLLYHFACYKLAHRRVDQLMFESTRFSKSFYERLGATREIKDNEYRHHITKNDALTNTKTTLETYFNPTRLSKNSNTNWQNPPAEESATTNPDPDSIFDIEL